MGFPTVWHSQITALRTSFEVQLQGPTIQGATVRVSKLPAASST